MSVNKTQITAKPIQPLVLSVPCSFTKLPKEILGLVLSHLTDRDDIESAELVCSQFYATSKDEQTQNERETNRRIEKLSTPAFQRAIDELAEAVAIPDTSDEVLQEKETNLYRCITSLLSKEYKPDHYHVDMGLYAKTIHKVVRERCANILRRAEKAVSAKAEENLQKSYKFLQQIFIGDLNAHARYSSLAVMLPEVFFSDPLLINILEGIEKTKPIDDHLYFYTIGDFLWKAMGQFKIQMDAEFGAEVFDKAIQAYIDSTLIDPSHDGSAPDVYVKKFQAMVSLFENSGKSIMKPGGKLDPYADKLEIMPYLHLLELFKRVISSFSQMKEQHPEMDDRVLSNMMGNLRGQVNSALLNYLINDLLECLEKNKPLQILYNRLLNYNAAALRLEPIAIKQMFKDKFIESCAISSVLPSRAKKILNREDVTLDPAELKLEAAQFLRQSRVSANKKEIETFEKSLQGGTLAQAEKDMEAANASLAECYKKASEIFKQPVDDTTGLDSLPATESRLLDEIHEKRIAQMKAERHYRRLKAKHDRLQSEKAQLESKEPAQIQAFAQKEEQEILKLVETMQENAEFLRQLSKS